MVAIPSSSGQSFQQLKISFGSSSKIKVAIPSSSGQSFQQTKRIPFRTPNYRRNPFFIRSILPTRTAVPRRGNPEIVAIPSSSGQSFQQPSPRSWQSVESVAIPSSSGQSFQQCQTKIIMLLLGCRNPFFIRSILPTPDSHSIPQPVERSQSLLHQVNPSNEWLDDSQPFPFFVAIPSSSGQSFQHIHRHKVGFPFPSRNPFFIRSILPTIGKLTISCKMADVAIPSSSGQSFQLLFLFLFTLYQFASQSLLHQVNPSNNFLSKTLFWIAQSRNPFFIRSILPTAGLLSFNFTIT